MSKVTVGFKETKEVVDFVIDLSDGIVSTMQDDEVTLSDIPNFFPAVFSLLPAIQGVDQVVLEFKLATPEEAEELKAHLRERVDLEDDDMEKFIEDAFAVVLDIWNVVKTYFLKDEGNGEPTSNGEVTADASPDQPKT